MVWPKNGACPESGRSAGDDVHHGRLARAVGADDAAQLAGVDFQDSLLRGAEAVEADRDVVPR